MQIRTEKKNKRSVHLLSLLKKENVRHFWAIGLSFLWASDLNSNFNIVCYILWWSVDEKLLIKIYFVPWGLKSTLSLSKSNIDKYI